MPSSLDSVRQDTGLQHLLEIIPFDHLLLKDLLGDGFKQTKVLAQDLQSIVVGLVHQTTHFLVDRLSGGITDGAAGVVALAEEAVAALLVVGQRAQGVAHSIGPHHLLSQVGGPLEIVRRPGCDLAEHDLLRGATTQQGGDLTLKLLL